MECLHLSLPSTSAKSLLQTLEARFMKMKWAIRSHSHNGLLMRGMIYVQLLKDVCDSVSEH